MVNVVAKLKGLYQKVTRGFSDDITWDLDRQLAVWLLPRLKRFKELNNGYPDHLTPQEWDNKLTLIIESLESIVHDQNLLWHRIALLTDEQQTEEIKKKMKKHEHGLKLLGQYLLHFWW